MKNPEITTFLKDVELDKPWRDYYSEKISAVSITAAEIKDIMEDGDRIKFSSSLTELNSCHPFGKGAGQLSMTPGHILSDYQNGLAFTVLKSAVGVTADGDIGIDDWQKSAPKMVCEKRTARDGRDGWTISWKGRGWDKGFREYLEFYRLTLLQERPGHIAIPSLMVDVTDRDRAIDQAIYCLTDLASIHEKWAHDDPFLVEIDISPTLNLLPGADDNEVFREFVKTSVYAFFYGMPEPHKYIVKIPNAGRGPEFQVQLVKDSIEISGERLAGVIIGNRLFDKEAEFEGQKGIAYGGWDLSNANLATLDLMIEEGIKVPLIATGNICSGRMMLEYALRGCSMGQIHTFFQLPSTAYKVPRGNGGRVSQALTQLLYDPDEGLIPSMLKLEQCGLLQRYYESGETHFYASYLDYDDLPGIYHMVRGYNK